MLFKNSAQVIDHILFDEMIRNNFSKTEFVTVMSKLGEYCAKGTDEIPRDGEKAAYWRKIEEQS